METCKKGKNEMDQRQQEEEATSRRGDSDRIRSLGRCPGVCWMSNQVPSGQGPTTSIPSAFSTPLTRRPKRGQKCEARDNDACHTTTQHAPKCS